MRAFFAALVLLTACATSVHGPDGRRARAGQAVDLLGEQGFSGSVLVACGDRVMFSGDYGVADARGREPSYWLASISKQFTAAAILQLMEQGRLALDDPISRFFPDAPADKSQITLRQLMTHRSGLTQAYAADGIVDRAEAARAIFASPLADPPGQAFHYSNDNYSLLAMVAEIVSGEPFEDYMRAHVFARAGLRHAGWWPDRGDDFVPPPLRTLEGAARRANWGFRGGTGARASVRDLHRWVRSLDAGEVISHASVALLYGPHTTTAGGDRVGFGWFWSDLPDGSWLWTRGTEDWGANVTLYRRANSDLVIIAATNAGPAESEGPGWSRRARDALMPIYDSNACG